MLLTVLDGANQVATSTKGIVDNYSETHVSALVFDENQLLINWRLLKGTPASWATFAIA